MFMVRDSVVYSGMSRGGPSMMLRNSLERKVSAKDSASAASYLEHRCILCGNRLEPSRRNKSNELPNTGGVCRSCREKEGKRADARVEQKRLDQAGTGKKSNPFGTSLFSANSPRKPRGPRGFGR